MKPFKSIYELYDIDQPNGFSKQNIESIKNIFGYLSKILIDYYEQLANYDFNYTQNFLLRAEDYRKKRFQDLNYLILYSENQGCNYWILKKEDLNKDNPPIYNLTDEGDCSV